MFSVLKTHLLIISLHCPTYILLAQMFSQKGHNSNTNTYLLTCNKDSDYTENSIFNPSSHSIS